MESWWLRCRVAQGMLPGEYAIITSTSDGREISLFAPDESVRAQEGLLRVTVLEHSDDRTLIFLPGTPFEASRTVLVPRRELVSA